VGNVRGVEARTFTVIEGDTGRVDLAYGEPGKVIRLFLLAREIDADPVVATVKGLQEFDIRATWRFRQIPPVRRR
jgi:hypothetical protein